MSGLEMDPEQRSQIVRRDFLRLTGLAATLLWLPPPLLRASTARAVELDQPFRILSDRFPIGLWSPPPPSESTPARYQEIADAGFTFVIGGNPVPDAVQVPPPFDAAAGAGLDYLISDEPLMRRISNGATNIANRVRTLVNNHEDKPAFAGINLYDEPPHRLFEFVAVARDTLGARAPSLLPFTNAFPTYDEAKWGTETYAEYIDSLLEVVRPPVLSFDHYPLLVGPATTDDYFDNWSVIRQRALAAGIPAWVVIQSLGYTGLEGYDDRRRPTKRELLWQVNVSLAYGAQGIMYFTYWTPPGAAFGEALVTRTGELTNLYDAAAQTNEYLASVGTVLLGLTSLSVSHANEPSVPQGATPFTGDDYVASSEGDAVILGLFDGREANQRHLMVTNRSFENHAWASLGFTEAVEAVHVFNPANEDFRPVPPGEDEDLRVHLTPGGAKLYRLLTSGG
jgi:hypothetical protein